MMPNRVIKKATRKGQKLRLAIDGPTGAGKTFTALMAAEELADKPGSVLVVDSERGSAALYSDRWEFDTIDWEPPYDPRELVPVLREHGEDYDVIVVDSLSHFWFGEGGTLDIVDTAARRQFSGNRYAGWQEGTPAQNDLVEALISAPCHVIVTMRSKMAYVLDEQNRPQKIGMQPQQRDGLEYEFTVVADMDISHNVTIGKTRCDLIADKVYRQGHTLEMVTTLKEWLNTAEPMASPAQVRQIKSLFDVVDDRDARRDLKAAFVDQFGHPDRLSRSEAEQAIEWVADAADRAPDDGGWEDPDEHEAEPAGEYLPPDDDDPSAVVDPDDYAGRLAAAAEPGDAAERIASVADRKRDQVAEQLAAMGHHPDDDLSSLDEAAAS